MDIDLKNSGKELQNINCEEENDETKKSLIDFDFFSKPNNQGNICSFVTVPFLSMSWISDKAKEQFEKTNVKKVVVCDLEKVIELRNDKADTSELKNIADEGVSHIIAEVDVNGNVIEMEGIVVEDIEDDVQKLINKTGEGMVVILKGE